MCLVSHVLHCSRAEVQGALPACQEANFLHCYICTALGFGYQW